MNKSFEITVCTPVSFFHLEGVSPLSIQILSMAYGYRLSGKKFYASDTFLADVFNKTDRGVRKSIQQLKQKDFIKSEILRDAKTKQVRGRILELTPNFDNTIKSIRDRRNQGSFSSKNPTLELNDPQEPAFHQAPDLTEPAFRNPQEPAFQKPEEPQFPLYSRKRYSSNYILERERTREENSSNFEIEFLEPETELISDQEKSPPNCAAPPPSEAVEEIKVEVEIGHDWEERIIKKIRPTRRDLETLMMQKSFMRNPDFDIELMLAPYATWRISKWSEEGLTDQAIEALVSKPNASGLKRNFANSWLREANYKKYNGNGKSSSSTSRHEDKIGLFETISEAANRDNIAAYTAARKANRTGPTF